MQEQRFARPDGAGNGRKFSREQRRPDRSHELMVLLGLKEPGRLEVALQPVEVHDLAQHGRAPAVWK
jgi:hypothetical protein